MSAPTLVVAVFTTDSPVFDAAGRPLIAGEVDFVALWAVQDVAGSKALSTHHAPEVEPANVATILRAAANQFAPEGG
jgi:hypothetical protein